MRSFLRLFSAAVLVIAVSPLACSANVTIRDDAGATCEVGGDTFEIGDTIRGSDECETCTCEKGGNVVCSDICASCIGDPPPCGGCNVYCIEGTWTCDVNCTDECGDPPPISCEETPPGCFWDGPVCTNGSWSCGELICEGDPCDEPPPECPDPGEPGCFSQLECSDFGWECFVTCEMLPCEEQYQEGYFTVLGLIVDGCGCQPNAVCEMACSDVDSCAGMPSDQCWECISVASEMGEECIFDAAFGDACQSDPQCAAYVDCAVNQ